MSNAHLFSRLHVIAPILMLTALSTSAAETDPFTKREPPPLAGRWNLKVRDADKEYPSWFEVRLSGYRTLVGSYVGRSGSVRPIAEVKWDEKIGGFRFVLPPQWERRTNDIVFEGKLQGEML